jgi:hypothetical protein
MQEVDLNATVTGGRREIPNMEAEDPFADAKLLSDTYTAEWDYFTVGGNNTMKVGTGLSLTYAYKENYAWRLFVDYDYTRKTYTMTYDPFKFLSAAINQELGEINVSQSIKKKRHTFIFGGSFTVSF